MSRCLPNGMTADERAATVCLYRENRSYRSIAQDRGVSPSAIRHRLVRWGYDLEPRDARKSRKPIYAFVAARAKGITFSDIASAYFISHVAVFKRLTKAGVPTDCSFLLRLTEEQRAVYRAALDEDRLPHRDALELAEEIVAEAA